MNYAYLYPEWTPDWVLSMNRQLLGMDYAMLVSQTLHT